MEGVNAILDSGGESLLTGLVVLASKLVEGGGHEEWLSEFRDWMLHEMN